MPPDRRASLVPSPRPPSFTGGVHERLFAALVHLHLLSPSDRARFNEAVKLAFPEE